MLSITEVAVIRDTFNVTIAQLRDAIHNFGLVYKRGAMLK
jgi:hypothetical protein